MNRNFGIARYYDINAPKERIEHPETREALVKQEADLMARKLVLIEKGVSLTDEEVSELNQITEQIKTVREKMQNMLTNATQERQKAEDRFNNEVTQSSATESEQAAAIAARNDETSKLRETHQAALSAVTETSATQQRAEMALQNFEKTKNSAIVARLFGLEDDFFKANRF